jgi:hypothetical protein
VVRVVERLVASGGSEVGKHKVGTKRSAVVMITNPAAIHLPYIAVGDGVTFGELATGLIYPVSRTSTVHVGYRGGVSGCIL